MIKVLFDSSVFNEQRFKLLRKDKLSELVANNRIGIFGNSILLEELLPIFYKSRKNFQDYIQYIFKITHLPLFKFLNEIVLEELKGGNLRNDYMYISPYQQIDNEYTIINMAFNNVEYIKKNEFKQICDEQRKERKSQIKILKKIKEENKQLFQISNNIEFIEFYNMEKKEFVKSVLEYFLIKDNIISNSTIIDLQNNEYKYPYTVLWLKGQLYILFHSLIMKRKVEENDFIDINYIILSKEADIFVSEDIKFMKETFKKLWSGDGKIYYSIDEFNAFMTSQT